MTFRIQMAAETEIRWQFRFGMNHYGLPVRRLMTAAVTQSVFGLWFIGRLSYRFSPWGRAGIAYSAEPRSGLGWCWRLRQQYSLSLDYSSTPLSRLGFFKRPPGRRSSALGWYWPASPSLKDLPKSNCASPRDRPLCTSKTDWEWLPPKRPWANLNEPVVTSAESRHEELRVTGPRATIFSKQEYNPKGTGR